MSGTLPNQKQKIQNLVRQKTIESFECCAGHHQSFFTDPNDGTILKKNEIADGNISEGHIMKKMQSQTISCLIPKLIELVEIEKVEFIKMENLTRRFKAPAIMDVKLGSRTYLFYEANNRQRNDLYKSVTPVKAYRIEGFRRSCGEKFDKFCLNRIADKKTAMKYFELFLRCSTIPLAEICTKIVKKLTYIKTRAQSSPFFSSHLFIGTSLLFILDENGSFDVKLIDFAKVREFNPTKEDPLPNSEWFRGLDNLIRDFSEISTLNVPTNS
ncbi:Oidioi.mRNA.OKI2018_I69.XSR.g14045.t1.cds [Oikopleura dioica]|uniref:Kinase n=1 Tax=Oikopleura dioica TaxID=34765 RepID=A0ABN7S8T3_OIKDI|nr:Oidioi.mRNA.OKI2018_I69.XSR.g14045.t1.cds [Oikopleura dioica]